MRGEKESLLVADGGISEHLELAVGIKDTVSVAMRYRHTDNWPATTADLQAATNMRIESQPMFVLKPLQCQACRQNCCNLAEADWIGQ